MTLVFTNNSTFSVPLDPPHLSLFQVVVDWTSVQGYIYIYIYIYVPCAEYSKIIYFLD